MRRPVPKFLARQFFAVKEDAPFEPAIEGLLKTFRDDAGYFAGDNLITWGKSCGWMEDMAFIDAFNRHTGTPLERGAVWRTVTLTWAMRQALRVEGDLVECGCYKGVSARILYDVAGLAASTRRLFLYDLFQGAANIAKHEMPEHGPELEQAVRDRFAGCSNVTITAGRVPDTLEGTAPDKIAFLHIDMNNVEAEIGALNMLFERVTPGGVIILDDYGWTAYYEQQQAERRWFAERGYAVLELPTGQGMVIR